MFQKINWFLVLTIAVFTGTMAFILTAPVTPNLAWATTNDCLEAKTDGGFSNRHLELDDTNPLYPCGHQFKVRHFGYGTENNKCNCAHHFTCMTLVITNPAQGDQVVYSADMNVVNLVNDCGSGNTDSTEFCVNIHSKYKQTDQSWGYYFICDNGERLPSTGNYYYFAEDTQYCQQYVSEWGSGFCCDEY